MSETPEPYEAIILADSIAFGTRLTTFCVTFPRIVLAEFNTHRVFSRNSASSRAIPVKKRIEQIRKNPYIPLSFGKNKRGMQAGASMDDASSEAARARWLFAMQQACDSAERLAGIGLHKQWANRLIEPFAWHTVIVSATEWDNFWALRISAHAQPEIRKVAEAMKAAMDASEPRELQAGQWHLPLIGTPQGDCCYGMHIAGNQHTWDCFGGRNGLGQDDQDPIDPALLVKLSVARCAAVSYERHMDHDIDKDLARYDKLLSAGHMSPFEHAAMVGYPMQKGTRLSSTKPGTQGWAVRGQRFESRRSRHEFLDDSDCIHCGVYGPAGGERQPCAFTFIGNFRAPWIQHRKLIPGEAVFGSAN